MPRSPKNRCTIFSGRFAGTFFENAVELRKRLKSDGERNFADSKIAFLQKFKGVVESHPRDVIDKLDPGHLFEFFAEVGRVDSDGAGHFLERNMFAGVFFDESPCFPDVPGFGSLPLVLESAKMGEARFGCIVQLHSLLKPGRFASSLRRLPFACRILR